MSEYEFLWKYEEDHEIKGLFWDAIDVLWVFDGNRVFSIEAEQEMIKEGDENVEETNGYACSTYEEAKQILIDYDYI